MSGRSRTRRPPSLDLSLSSRGSSRSRTCSPELESEDDSSRTTSHNHRRRIQCHDTDNTHDRPATGEMRIFPTGPYCFKQPTLAEVLSNTASPPYTLSAFMAYLSQNHCLETLEFTMDANRYRKHYNSVANNGKGSQSSLNAKDCAFVRKLWQKLLDAYIIPDGPREVNLPCSIRDQILSVPNQRIPPPPEYLDSAVHIVHELMQESVLVPFLSECQTNTFAADPGCPAAPWAGNGSDESLFARGSLDERLLRRKREASPPSPVDIFSHSYATGVPPRVARTTSPFSATLGWHTRKSSHPSQPPSSWTSNASGDSMMIDDSGSSTPSWGTPMTPPTTPPASEAMLVGTAGSPKRTTTGEKAEKGWKRMTGGLGRGLGWGRKRESSSSHSNYW